jgi:serine kinase of HPr protein (carbohydrate metabolism regulator)
MTVREVVDTLKLAVCSGADNLDREVTGGYVGDLLSNVIANAQSGNVWITMQVHVNIVAVAVLKELAAIILVQGREPAEDTLKRAAEEKVTILASQLSSFELAGKLHELGIGKVR